eukprot:12716170-Heterocapsa_arctica.AAC.1
MYGTNQEHTLRPFVLIVCACVHCGDPIVTLVNLLVGSYFARAPTVNALRANCVAHLLNAAML